MSAEERLAPLDLVGRASGYLRRHGVESHRLDAELLLAHALGARRLDLYLRFEEVVGSPARDRFRELVRLRALERVPVAYLTGEREFWSRSFRVTEGVLIPRPETEGVVEAVVELRPSCVVDAGTGCGAIACAVALELHETRVVGVDRSLAALRVASENVGRFGLSNRVMLCCADFLSSLRSWPDVICGNLPYVPTAELESLPPEVRCEPRVALDGGPDGLEPIRGLLALAPMRLRGPGALVLEVGEGQASRVEALLRAAGADVTEVRKDLAGIERVVIGHFSPRPRRPGQGRSGRAGGA